MVGKQEGVPSVGDLVVVWGFGTIKSKRMGEVTKAYVVQELLGEV